jgi:folate-binding protein YgfZ
MTSQYLTITEQAGWLAGGSRGLLRFEGGDAASFLHALVTNDVESLTSGQGTYAAWLTPQGRMITDLQLLRDDTGVWASVPADLAAQLQARFDQLIFSEDVRVSDESGGWTCLRCVGHAAPDAVAELTGISASTLAGLPVWGHVSQGDVRVVQTDETRLPTFQVWMTLGSGADAAVAGKSTSPFTFDALRIDAARPLFGVDMTTETIPLEAGLLDRAISQSKGCYVGQEVIVRVLHRGGGRVAKHLMQLESSDASLPAVGAVLRSGEREVGSVTSAAVSPSSGRGIALGYVHRDVARPGETLETPDGQRLSIVTFAG